MTAQSSPAVHGLEYALNGGTYQSSPIFMGLGNGTYSVSVRDLVTGCTATLSGVQVFCITECEATASNNGPVCATTTLTLTANAGGVSYNWNGPGGTTSGQTANINNVSLASAGTYTVTVTYANGCTAIATTFVEVLDRPTVLDLQVACNGTTGSVSVSGQSNPAANGVAYSLNGTDFQASGTFSGSGRRQLHGEHTRFGNRLLAHTTFLGLVWRRLPNAYHRRGDRSLCG